MDRAACPPEFQPRGMLTGPPSKFAYTVKHSKLQTKEASAKSSSCDREKRMLIWYTCTRKAGELCIVPERFSPIPTKTKQPIEDEKQPGGFSVYPKIDEGRQSSKRFRFDRQRWPETGGYPSISGGAQPSSESRLMKLYKDYIRALLPRTDEAGVEEIAQATFKENWERDDWQRQQKEMELREGIARAKRVHRYLAMREELEE